MFVASLFSYSRQYTEHEPLLQGSGSTLQAFVKPLHSKVLRKHPCEQATTKDSACLLRAQAEPGRGQLGKTILGTGIARSQT